MEGLDVGRIQAAQHHRAVPPPFVAVDGEQAIEAQRAGRRVELCAALEAVGPVAQHGGDGRRVGDDDEFAGGDAKAVDLAVLARPLLDLLVQAFALDLQRIAQERQAARPRELANAPHGRIRTRSIGGDRHVGPFAHRAPKARHLIRPFRSRTGRTGCSASAAEGPPAAARRPAAAARRRRAPCAAPAGRRPKRRRRSPCAA